VSSAPQDTRLPVLIALAGTGDDLAQQAIEAIRAVHVDDVPSLRWAAACLLARAEELGEGDGETDQP
jgi:hypothetical protein